MVQVPVIEQAIAPVTRQPVTKLYEAKSRIYLPHDFTVNYANVGSVTLDNKLLQNVKSLVIQDKHPMWVEPETQTLVTYDNIVETPEGLAFGKIVLTPDDPNETLEALITGKRFIPEVEALNKRINVTTYYSPEIVRVTTTGGSVSHRDIDFVFCNSPGGLTILLETPLALPKDVAYNPQPARQ